MPLVLTNGKIKIGAYRFHDRKKIAICVEEGNEISGCGCFNKITNAEYFMRKLAECVGVEHEDDNGDK